MKRDELISGPQRIITGRHGLPDAKATHHHWIVDMVDAHREGPCDVSFAECDCEIAEAVQAQVQGAAS